MKVLVTGGAGFLGRHLLKKLDKEGVDVVAIVRRSSDTGGLKGRKLSLVVGDLRDDDVIETAMQSVDVVIHAAATMGGSWDDFYAINVEATRRLLEAARRHGVRRFIHISSVSVYDHSSKGGGHVFTEDMPYETKQLTFYSKSKIEAEKVVWEYAQKDGVPCVVLRPGALYGIGGPLYPAQLGLPLGGNRFAVIGNGRSPVPLCHVQSVVDAVWLSIGNDAAIGGCYNLMEDDTIDRIDYLRKVKQIVNPELSIVKLPYWLARTMSLSFRILFGILGRKAPLRPLYLKTASRAFYYSTERAKRELGWQPSVDFDDSIEEVLNWHRQKRTPKRQMPIVKGKVEIPVGRKVRVAVAGCGAISDVHLSVLAGISNAEVVAVCDPSTEARNRVAKKYKIDRAYENLTELLCNEKVDVVHVVSPAQTHAALSIMAMRKGCHVLVEKPMATTAVEAEEMVRVAREAGVRLSLDHNHLYDGVMIQARELLAQGAVGQVTYVESWYGVGLSADGGNRVLSYDARNSWPYRMPGALYQDYISHPISLLTDVLGEVSHPKVTAKYYRVVPHMQTDELRVLVEGQSAIGLLSVSLASSPRYQFIKIYGTQGTLTVDLLNKYVFVDKSMGPVPKSIARSLSTLRQGRRLSSAGRKGLANALRGKLTLFEGTERLIRLFYRSVLLDEPVPVTPEEGLQSMKLMDEIWVQLNHGNGHVGRTETKESLVAQPAETA